MIIEAGTSIGTFTFAGGTGQDLLDFGEYESEIIIDLQAGTFDIAAGNVTGSFSGFEAVIGGDELDEAVMAWVKKEYNLMLGERTSEQVKMAIGSAFPFPSTASSPRSPAGVPPPWRARRRPSRPPST